MTEFKPQNAELIKQPRFILPYHKIVSTAIAIAMCSEWRAKGETVAVSDGCYDILHYKHAEYIAAIANQVDHLVIRVVENTKKDPRGSVIPFSERLKMLAHLHPVDAVTGMQEDSGLDWIEEFKPDKVFKSTTSGVNVMNEIDQVMNLKHQAEIIVLDEDCNFVPLSEAAAKGQQYDDTKFDPNRSSGSTHKRTIQNRQIEDLQPYLQCDLSQILRNNI
jgi:cytidyltransferase-like protein